MLGYIKEFNETNPFTEAKVNQIKIYCSRFSVLILIVIGPVKN
jgi:hypothetical protein